uniref:NADH-ubiquinone oxidoreductase chain 6 n=1 Tax=Myrmus lateralis TaxID=2717128 RepID=A0A6G8QTG2_9HEMI|nr:NADH dehydrogenase subunit 6 [Myrmus lateralis]QIN90647.1 NADH dehydrogenase subunit 6 [Myrmus lateralis]
MLLMILLTMALIFMWLNHPISMGITIIMQTLIISLISGLMLSSFWFSYILMITMLSGMLVLFIYMASIASNEKFFPSMKLMFMSLIMISLGTFLHYNNKFDDNEMLMIKTNLSTEAISLMMMFNMKHKYITLLLVMFLFITMITISLIVNISEGPLRVNK